EEFLDLVQLVLVGGADVAIAFHGGDRLVVDLAADDGAVVARIQDAELLARRLDLLQVRGVELPVGNRFLHLFAESFLLLVSLEPALDAVLKSHMSSSTHEGREEFARNFGGLVGPRFESQECITNTTLDANPVAIKEQARFR